MTDVQPVMRLNSKQHPEIVLLPPQDLRDQPVVIPMPRHVVGSIIEHEYKGNLLLAAETAMSSTDVSFPFAGRRVLCKAQAPSVTGFSRTNQRRGMLVDVRRQVEAGLAGGGVSS